MILYPAIDIYEGKAVRLRQGSFSDETVYRDDPLDAALAWIDGGAKALHVVDLDGAKSGAPANLEHLRRIVARCSVPVQFGGGLRSLAAVNDAFAAGAQRVIIGTAAFKDEELLAAALHEYRQRVWVGVDAREQSVATHGWIETSELKATVAIEQLATRGVEGFVYTDIDRDGMLEGPDLEEAQVTATAVPGEFIYSGGIGRLDDLRQLAELKLSNLVGVIVGKALYERRFTVAQGQAALEGKE